MINQILQVLNSLQTHTSNGISYKVIRGEQVSKLQLKKSNMPKIKLKDPLLKGSLAECGDVIAIYRDYELNVSPYYYYRIVEL